MNKVSCSNCKKFTPDDIGSGKGIGRCAAFDAQIAFKIPVKRLNQFFSEQLGNKQFWGGDGDDRYCLRFVDKEVQL